jgi:hypothetical protein
VTGTNIVTTRDLNVYVAAPPTNAGFAGSYVGVETADPANTGSIQLRTTTIGVIQPTGSQSYTASDILQTNPATITNPTYLASAGIQVGPGTDLVTKSAGGRGFSTYIYPTTLFYGCRDVISNTKTGWLWPGSLTFSNSTPKYPDSSIAMYRVQQPLIVSGMTVYAGVAPGNGKNLIITVCKNATTTPPTGGQLTTMTVTLTNTNQNISYYNSSVNFAAGDLLSVYLSTTSNVLTDVSIQIDCF